MPNAPEGSAGTKEPKMWDIATMEKLNDMSPAERKAWHASVAPEPIEAQIARQSAKRLQAENIRPIASPDMAIAGEVTLA